jgi:hypothetical protein
MMEDVPMDGITEPCPGEGRFDTLIRLLGVKDQQLRQDAAAMFCQVGKPIVPTLVHEAQRPGRRQQHRIAILDVVQQIGGPIEPDALFGLQSLLRHHDAAISAKVEQVIMSLSPGGVPKSPEGLALERVFNPFLAIPPSRRRGPSPLQRYKKYCQQQVKVRREKQR